MFNPMIEYVFDFVSQNGTQIKFADTVYQTNVWEWNGLRVTSCEADNTRGVIWGNRLNVYQVDEEEPIYNSTGTEHELELVYYGLNAAEVDCQV